MIKRTDLCARICYFPLKLRSRLARLKAAYLDQKLGIETKEDGPLPVFDPEGNVPYQPTPYGRLEKMMRFLHPSEEDVFIDLGCGKGRAVFLAAMHPFKKVIGVETDRKAYDAAVQNAMKVKFRRAPVELIHSDAADFDPREGTVFFMFNPFGTPALKKVLFNIKSSLASNPRKIRMVYYVPQHKELLEEEDWLMPAGKVENKMCLVWESIVPGESNRCGGRIFL